MWRHWGHCFPSFLSAELSWLGRRVRHLLPLLLLNLGAIVVGSALTLADPLIVKWLIDVALPQKNLGLVLTGTVVFCGVYLASLGASFFASFLSPVASQTLSSPVRLLSFPL